jgi:hypothetical protein
MNLAVEGFSIKDNFNIFNKSLFKFNNNHGHTNTIVLAGDWVEKFYEVGWCKHKIMLKDNQLYRFSGPVLDSFI